MLGDTFISHLVPEGARHLYEHQALLAVQDVGQLGPMHAEEDVVLRQRTDQIFQAGAVLVSRVIVGFYGMLRRGA